MATENITNRPFRPVKCSEVDIQNMKPVEGYVYFTSDTHKIYAGMNGEFAPMGGNSGIYYGQRPLADSEVNAEAGTEFVFEAEQIEGDQTPNKDDLILNIPDGGFYRVTETMGSTIVAIRLAVSGMGGGSGSGGGSSTSKPVIILLTESKDLYFASTDTAKMKIRYKCSSPVDDGVNYISTVKYYFGSTSVVESVDYKFGEEIIFDISKYYNSFNNNGSNTITIEVEDIYGNLSSQKRVSFTIATMSLVSRVTAIAKAEKNSDSAYRFICMPQGGDTLEDKKLEITITPLNEPSNEVYYITKAVTDLNINYDFNILFKEIEYANHGVYLLTAKYSGQVPYSTVRMYANDINVQIIVYDDTVGSPLIASDFLDTAIMQYDSFTLQYMVVAESSTADITPTIYYGDNSEQQIATVNELNTWTYTFVQPGTYELAIEYEGSKVVLGNLIVNIYSGDIPTIDESATALYLTALGRSNSQTNRETWESNGYEAKFENFLWGTENGWLIDSDTGETALKITNGAKVTLPTFHPFANSAIKTGLTIELDFKVSGVLNYAKPLIHCLSQYTNSEGKSIIQTGFQITGQKATLNSNYYKATSTELDGSDEENINEQDMALQAFTQYFNEDTRIHLTYVIDYVPDWSLIGDNDYYYVYTYLNGVLSGLMRLSVDKKNKTADTFQDYASAPSVLTFDSTYGDIYIYNIRTYYKALDMRTVIKNYIADLSNIDERIALYKDNNIFDSTGLINIKAIQDISYSCGVPYVLFNGGNAMNKKFKDAFTYEESGTKALPTSKTDYRYMSMKMYDVNKANETYLRLDIPIEAQNNEDENDIATSFSQLTSGKSYLPKRGVQVYGQGTSSMVYPVKNLRLKFIQEQDYPTIYDGSYPVEIVCFKADFMDSSSSHNTGTGNLVYDLYKSMNLRTPAQQFKLDNQGKEGVAEYDLVTAIRGYPIICFFAEGDSQDYQYIGRYNFNMDKATPEPFGFIPQKVYTGKTTSTGRKEVKVCGLMTEEVEGMTVLPVDAEGNEIERDIVQCWEVKNNDNGSPTKFRTLSDFASFHDSLVSKNAKGTNSNWTEYFEDRYPDAMVSGDSYINGDTSEDEYPNLTEDLNNGLFRVAEWINSTAIGYGSDIPSEATNASLAEPKYYQTMDDSWDESKQYYNSDGSTYEVTVSSKVAITQTSLSNENALTNVTINSDTFISKVGDGNFNTYAFLYADDGWTLNGETASISDYGISFNGTPKVNDTGLTVTYSQTNTWSNNLYEKYEIDNDNYRLAKFKTEFSDYFDLDFCLFYYNLTLALLMMDSRAKNMMLASWDQKIWYPIFYDMDTMLGVNNTGFNKFSFDTEDDPDDKVFNGFDSVLWNNFRLCFGTRIANNYRTMRNYMTINKLTDTYNTNSADKWNEALTSADAQYKHIRPYEEGYYDGANGETVAPGQISYLYAAQGRRSNHRVWWLSNRLNYLDSKFLPSTYGGTSPTQNQAFNFRAYALPEQKNTSAAQACVAQTPANHKFDLTALNTSYQALLIGNIAYTSGDIVNAGEMVTLGPNEVKHEVESYILNPLLISDLGDLSDKYIGSFNLPSSTKLLKLKLGRSSRSNPDSYDKYYNSLLSQLNLGSSCPYLQELNIARCTGLRTVDLSNCSRLEKIDAEGSKLTSISFPASSILKELYLPSTLTSLVLTNQPYLTNIEFDSETLNYLDTIRLDEVPQFNSYELIKKQCDGITIRTFYLKNFNWTITDTQKAMEGNTLTGIDILDALSNTNKVQVPDGVARKQAFSGTITIDIPNAEIDEYELYKKYKDIFPNIEIKYGENIGSIKPAYTLTFKSDNTSDATVIYTVKTNGELTLEAQTSKDTSPNGESLKVPTKANTNQYTYTFTGYWIDESGIKYATNEVVDIVSGAKTFAEFIPISNMVFYPEYDQSITKHKVVFYDQDKKVISQTNANGVEQDYWLVPYGDLYDGPVLNYYYRDESDLEENERWNFVGWTKAYYGEKTDSNASSVDSTIIDPTDSLKITGAMNLYACFEKVDVETVAHKAQYFNVSNTGVISLKEEYRKQIKGKLSIPKLYKSNSTEPATTVGALSTNNDPKTYLTAIYFVDGNNYTTFDGSLYGNTNLTIVKLPTSITTIGNNAFSNCTNLKTINLNELVNLTSIGSSAFNSCSKLEMNELPSGLADVQASNGSVTPGLGANSFSAAGNQSENFILTKLPEGITYLDTGVFNVCYKANITTFGSAEKPFGYFGTTTFGHSALGYAGSGLTGNETITMYIAENVKVPGSSPFNLFGGKDMTFNKVVIHHHTMTASQAEEFCSALGLKAATYEVENDI